MTTEKVREDRLRRMAYRQGFRLCKSKRRDKLAKGYGGYCMIDDESDYDIVYGGNFQATLDQIETHLTKRPGMRWPSLSTPTRRIGIAGDRSFTIEPGSPQEKALWAAIKRGDVDVQVLEDVPKPRRMVDREGNVHPGVGGCVEPTVSFHWPHIGESLCSERLSRLIPDKATRDSVAGFGLQVLVSILAGPVADERHGGPWIEAVGDWEEARAIARFLDHEGFERILKWAHQITRDFMDEPGMWERVIAVADVLTAEGYVDGDHPVLQGMEHRTLAWKPPAGPS